MGYWKGKSLELAFLKDRSLGFLLGKGDARCGEWTSFFQNTLLAQGIDVKKENTIEIRTFASDDRAAKDYAQSKKGKPGSYTSPCKYRAETFDTEKKSHSFSVKPATYTYNEKSKIQLLTKSFGQGNADSKLTKTKVHLFEDHVWLYYKQAGRFFDPSYGKSFTFEESNLKTYCEKSMGNIAAYVGVEGEKGFRMEMETENLHNFISATRDLFKPPV